MPKIDLTITISVVIAVCAIISPMITTAMTHHHQAKLKKLELADTTYKNTVLYKRTIFENYLKYAGRCTSYSDDSAMQEYGECYLLALMYAPSDLQQEMKETHALMLEYHWKDATKI